MISGPRWSIRRGFSVPRRSRHCLGYGSASPPPDGLTGALCHHRITSGLPAIAHCASGEKRCSISDRRLICACLLAGNGGHGSGKIRTYIECKTAGLCGFTVRQGRRLSQGPDCRSAGLARRWRKPDLRWESTDPVLGREIGSDAERTKEANTGASGRSPFRSQGPRNAGRHQSSAKDEAP